MDPIDRFLAKLDREDRLPRGMNRPVRRGGSSVKTVDEIEAELRKKFPFDSPYNIPTDETKALKLYMGQKAWVRAIDMTKTELRDARYSIKDILDHNYSNKQLHGDAFLRLSAVERNMRRRLKRLKFMDDLLTQILLERTEIHLQYWDGIPYNNIIKTAEGTNDALVYVGREIKGHDFEFPLEKENRIYRKIAEMVHREQITLFGYTP